VVLSSDTPGPRILIVDDQRSNVRLLEHALRRAGYTEVMSTTSPREVAALHLQHRYALILLDLQMPELSGFEVMKELQETRSTHPVSILVLSADPAQQNAALEHGADSFIPKPFRLPDVVERIESILKTPAGDHDPAPPTAEDSGSSQASETKPEP
jgi:CheY-like chemotaxis protein